MNVQDTEELLAQVKAVWRTTDVSPAAVKVWQRSLVDLPLEAAETALDAYVRGISDDYPPKPADLRRMIVDAMLALPSVDDAWLAVQKEARRVGMRHTVFHDGVSYKVEPSFIVPEVALAAEAVGWTRIVGSISDSFTARDFSESYGRYVNRTRNAAILSMDGIDAFRSSLGGDLRSVTIGEPKGLYQLGAPEWYAAQADGSGPGRISGPAVLPPSPESSATALPAPRVAPDQASANAEKIHAAISVIAGTRRVRGPSTAVGAGQRVPG